MAFSGTRFGIALPQIFTDGIVDVASIARFARRAEELNFDSLWTQEQQIGKNPSIDPITLLSYVSGFTEKPKLGISVLVLARHNPVQLAKQLASIDHLSNGRLIVGVGVGGGFKSVSMVGLPTDRPVRILIEGLSVMKAIWEEGSANIDGQVWSLTDVAVNPKPVQKPHPPIWFGARHTNALKRAARLGDGFMGAGSSSIDSFKESVKELRHFLEEEGRDPHAFPISKRLYLALDDDSVRAEQRLREWFGSYYGNPDLANRVAVWGSLSHVMGKIEEIIDAGAEMVLLNPVFDMMSHMESFAGVIGTST
jgi:probable F420-dependent oxidoreductase